MNWQAVNRMLYHTTKIVFIAIGWIFLQMQQPHTENMIPQLFEYSIALGILLLVLVTLYREWKQRMSYSRDQESDLRSLTERAVKAIEQNTAKMDELITYFKNRDA